MKKLLAVVAVAFAVAAALVVAYKAGRGTLPWKIVPARHAAEPGADAAGYAEKNQPSYDKSPRRVVLVVQNHTSDAPSFPMAAVADSFAAALSTGNLRVANPYNAIGVNQNRAATGEAMPETSALNLARMLGADGVVTASILEFTGEDIGVPAIAHALKVRLAVNLADAATGETICGVQDVATGRNVTKEKLKADTATEYEGLLHEAVARCSSEVLAKYEKCNWKPAGFKTVEVEFVCNIEGADVSIDGVSIGAAPIRARVAGGVRTVKVEYPFCEPFERKALLSDGQKYNATLKLDAVGRECFRDERLFNEKIADMRKNRETKAYMERILAEAKAEYIRKSAAGGSPDAGGKDIMAVIEEKIKSICR